MHAYIIESIGCIYIHDRKYEGFAIFIRKKYGDMYGEPKNKLHTVEQSSIEAGFRIFG